MKPPRNPLAGTIGSSDAGDAKAKARRGFYFPAWRRRVRRPGSTIVPASRPLDAKVAALGVPINGQAQRQAELGGYLSRGRRSDGR